MALIARLAGAVGALAIMAGGALAATPDPTSATSGYTYFNRPGATAADYDRELMGCIGTSVGAFQNGRLDRKGRIDSSATPLFGGIVPGLLFSMVEQDRLQANVQNCMTVAGWRVMRLDDAQGAALWKLPPPEIAHQLQAWAGVGQAPGEVVRSYENDAARRGAVVFALHTLPQLSVHSLALRAFDPSRLEPHPVKNTRGPNLKAKYVARTLNAAQAQAVPATDALAIFSFSGKSSSKYDLLQLRRFGATPEAYAWEADGRADEFFLWGEQPPVLFKADREVYAVALPPGRWRIISRSVTEMCLGAPVFEAKAGEVLYLGHFDLNAPVITPDLKLEGVPAGVPITPEQHARMRPAEWKNGARWPCYPSIALFAMEFPGFPAEAP